MGLWGGWLWTWLLAFVVTGCASSAGTITPLGMGVKPDSLARYTEVVYEVIAKGEAASTLTPEARERIVALIRLKAAEQAPGRRIRLATDAETIGPATSARSVAGMQPTAGVEPASDVDHAGASRTLHATIAVTRYDDGNAVLRFLFAGLGRIHLAAEVSLEDRARRMSLGRFETSKTFAWGGIYGALTSIEDVEDGFAETIVRIIVGQWTGSVER